MNTSVTTALLMVLTLPAAFSHAHPNHAGEIGHDHGDFVARALAVATSILVFTLAAALLRRRGRRLRKMRQHVVVE